MGRPFLLVWVLGLMSCVLDLSLKPQDVISCDLGVCPAGFKCTSFQRCVPNDSDDIVPPELLDFELSSPSVGQGQRLEIWLEVSEALGGSPQISLSVPGASKKIELFDAELREDGRYYFEYLTSGEDPEGLVDMVIVFSDLAGNPGSASIPGQLRFDFSAPLVLAETVSLQLRPDSENPLRDISSLGRQAVLTVLFALDERTESLEVFGQRGSQRLDFELISSSGTFHIFELRIPETYLPEDEEETYEVVVNAEDLAGNQRNQVISQEGNEEALRFDVDTTAPSPARSDIQDRIVQERRPWGRGADGPQVSLRGNSGSVEDSAWLAVYGDEDATIELARVQSDSDGAFGDDSGFVVSTSDRVQLWLQVIDQAGNQSAIVPVRDSRWLANYGQKRANNTISNPHEAWRVLSATGALFRDRDIPLNSADFESLWEEDEQSAQSLSESRWRRTMPVGPGPNVNTGVYRPGTGDFLAYSLGNLVDLPPQYWRYSENGWTVELAAGDSPPILFEPMMAHDSLRGVTVVHGGRKSLVDASPEVYEHDGEIWAQRSSGLALQAPGLFSGAFVFDPTRAEIVLFGGALFDTSGSCPDETEVFGALPVCSSADTWLWKGNAWLKLEGDAPSPRIAPAAAYDPISDRILLHGGQNDDESCASDTWAWDGMSWEILVNSSPVARARHSMAYDASLGTMMLYGGQQGSCGFSDDTYTNTLFAWNGDSWEPVLGVSGAPEAQPGVLLSVAQDEQVPWFFGFDQDGLKSAPIHRLSESAWLPVSNKGPNPDIRSRSQMGFHADLGQTLLHGGIRSGSCDGESSLCDTTWTFDGSIWSRHCVGDAGDPCSQSPEGRTDGVMAYDSDTEQVFLVGGARIGCDGGSDSYCDRTWAWNGTTWSQLCGPGVFCSPNLPGRDELAAAYDQSNERLVVFGGRNSIDFYEETWEFGDFSTGCAFGVTPCWRQLSTPITPGRRAGSSMYYDAAREVLVLFGGHFTPGVSGDCPDGSTWDNDDKCYYFDIWELEGSLWSQVALDELSPSPEARDPGAWLYDSERGRGILVAGRQNNLSYGDLWEFSGSAWREIKPEGESVLWTSTREAAYNSFQNNILSVGVEVEEDIMSYDVLTHNAENRASSHFTFDWTAAGLSEESYTLEKVELRVVGIGQGASVANTEVVDSFGEQQYGMRIRAWSHERLRWEQAQDFAAADNATQSVLWEASEPEVLRLGDDSQIHFLVETLFGQGNGIDVASLNIDYIELEVSYRTEGP